MKVIGLTGGIGSGKSYVADVAVKNFEILHISTDEIARRQMLNGGESFYRVVEEFSKYSDELLLENGEINRQVLGAIVLNDQMLLEKLDSITHPPVIEEVNKIIETERQNGRYAALMIETALIYEAGMDSICDEVWYVYAPRDTRKKRLMASRGYSEEKAEGFFRRQKPEEEFLKRAQRVVPNGADVTEEELVRIICAYLG